MSLATNQEIRAGVSRWREVCWPLGHFSVVVVVVVVVVVEDPREGPGEVGGVAC